MGFSIEELYADLSLSIPIQASIELEYADILCWVSMWKFMDIDIYDFIDIGSDTIFVDTNI